MSLFSYGAPSAVGSNERHKSCALLRETHRSYARRQRNRSELQRVLVPPLGARAGAPLHRGSVWKTMSEGTSTSSRTVEYTTSINRTLINSCIEL